MHLGMRIQIINVYIMCHAYFWKKEEEHFEENIMEM